MSELKMTVEQAKQIVAAEARKRAARKAYSERRRIRVKVLLAEAERILSSGPAKQA